MSLGERIALARKQAGLSQEQLGEKLGVSRQAVSKWEGDQTNPDVAYVAQMCRTLGVSSDWLLLGEEREADGLPRLCPHCQGTVTGLERFCPSCGQCLTDSPQNALDDGPYNLYLWSVGSKEQTQEALRKFYKELPGERDYILPECLQTDPLRYDITLTGAAPVQICGNADRAAALRARTLLSGSGELRTYPVEAGAHWMNLSDADIVEDLSSPRPPDAPMSFGMTVLAVIVGILGAMVLLMFL